MATKKKIWSVYEVGASYEGPLTEVEASSERSALDSAAAYYSVARSKLYAVPGALLTGKPDRQSLHHAKLRTASGKPSNARERFNVDQPEDKRPGFYYVTAIDAGRSARASGPYKTHAEALDDVRRVKETIEEMDPRAIWWAWGTMRSEKNLGPGFLESSASSASPRHHAAKSARATRGRSHATRAHHATRYDASDIVERLTAREQKALTTGTIGGVRLKKSISREVREGLALYGLVDGWSVTPLGREVADLIRSPRDWKKGDWL